MTSSNGNIFRVTGHLCGELTGDRWIPHAKASDAELWCFLWSALWRHCNDIVHQCSSTHFNWVWRHRGRVTPTNKSSLAEIMAYYHPTGGKPLSETIVGDDVLSIGVKKQQQFSLMKINLEILSAKWWPFLSCYAHFNILYVLTV